MTIKAIITDQEMVIVPIYHFYSVNMSFNVTLYLLKYYFMHILSISHILMIYE